jgi:hypothetical protein
VADALKYHEERVPAGSTEEQRLIVNLTAQGWKLLVRVGETDKHDYVRLVFSKLDALKRRR